MVGSTQFLTFAIGGGANVIDQATYAASSVVTNGYAAGTALSGYLNKTWRQSSFVAAGLTQLMANVLSIAINDDGNSAGFVTNLTNTIASMIETYSGAYSIDTGGANAYVIAPVPAVPAYAEPLQVRFKAINANTGASTINVSSLGVIALKRDDGTALQAGDIPAGSLVHATFVNTSGGQFWVDQVLPSQIQTINAGNLAIWGGTSGGLANAQTLVGTPTVATLASPLLIIFKAGFSNTAAMTMQIDSTAAKNVYKRTANGPMACTGGEIALNSLNVISYDGIQYELLIGVPPASSATGQFRNLVITNGGAPNTQMAITADELTLGDGLGNNVKSAVNVTPNATGVGVNGIDAGALAASTWYYLWVIFNPATQTTAGLISLSSTAPTLPAGYTYKGRVGAVVTDASNHFMRILQKGREAYYQVTVGSNTANLPNIASGAAGTPSTGTYVATSISGLVPPTASQIEVSAQSAGNPAIILVAPNNNYGVYGSGTNPPTINMSPASASILLCCVARLLLESANIYYAATGAGSSLWCLGWVDNL